MSHLDHASPAAAEAAFYAAFERGDADAMQAVWDDAPDVLCIHPMGPSLQGPGAVQESWQRLLSGGARMRFTPRLVNAYEDGQVAVHHVHEHIAYGTELDQHAVVIATNVYRHGQHGWRMVVHHGSPSRTGETSVQGVPGAALH